MIAFTKFIDQLKKQENLTTIKLQTVNKAINKL